MQILTETLTPEESNIILQESGQTKDLYISGVYAQSNVVNGNRRYYPRDIMQEAVGKAQQVIQKNGGIFGEAEHPQTLNINMDRISHVITELRMEGDLVYGKAKVLNTPMGNILRTLVLESGVKIGMSTRGAGNLNEQKQVSDFSIVTVDAVVTPSAPSAYVSGIYESLDSKQGNKVLTLAEQVCQDHDAQKYLKREIMRWINSELLKR